MKTLVSLNPVHELRAMEDLFDRVFSQPLARPTHSDLNPLPIDLIEETDRLVVRAAVPGVNPEELEVQVENNVLTIRGEAKQEEVSEKAKVYRRELPVGKFSRSIRLPENLNLDRVEAKFQHGIVTISLPKQEEVKPPVIRIPISSE